MDSVTQIALGASVCYAAIGPKIGKRALIIGAIVGSLPDLDVLVPYDDAIASFTYHRSWSHSLFVLSLCSLPLAWIIRRATARDLSGKASFAQWWLAIWLVLFTHPLLDIFTIYGTQIWWPLPLPPVAIGSIFIIDPLYTLPLLAGCIIAWRSTGSHGHKEFLLRLRARRVVIAGLTISCVYLGWTLFAYSFTAQRLEQQLQIQQIDAKTRVIAPFPTAVLWRIVVTNNDSYKETFASLLDERSVPLQFTTFPNAQEECLQKIASPSVHRAIKRMDWFTHGAIAVTRKNDRLLITDLRMGIEDDYVFTFDVRGWEADRFIPSPTIQQPLDFDFARLSSVLRRITDQSIKVSNARLNIHAADFPPIC